MHAMALCHACSGPQHITCANLLIDAVLLGTLPPRTCCGDTHGKVHSAIRVPFTHNYARFHTNCRTSPASSTFLCRVPWLTRSNAILPHFSTNLFTDNMALLRIVAAAAAVIHTTSAQQLSSCSGNLVMNGGFEADSNTPG
jgi:hypothetical protein